MKTFYKGFANKELNNHQNNFKYETDKKYRSLLVDDDKNNECSYGLNLFTSIDTCWKELTKKQKIIIAKRIVEIIE